MVYIPWISYAHMTWSGLQLHRIWHMSPGCQINIYNDMMSSCLQIQIMSLGCQISIPSYSAMVYRWSQKQKGPVNAADFGTKDGWLRWHTGLQIWHLHMTLFHAPWPQPMDGQSGFLVFTPIDLISSVANSTRDWIVVTLTLWHPKVHSLLNSSQQFF